MSFSLSFFLSLNNFHSFFSFLSLKKLFLPPIPPSCLSLDKIVISFSFPEQLFKFLSFFFRSLNNYFNVSLSLSLSKNIISFFLSLNNYFFLSYFFSKKNFLPSFPFPEQYCNLFLYFPEQLFCCLFLSLSVSQNFLPCFPSISSCYFKSKHKLPLIT